MPLIYTDRSRQEEGWRCLRRRYWKYSSVNGYGIDGKARAVPLVTGTEVHAALAGILAIVRQGNGAVKFPLSPAARAQVRGAITAACDSYRASVARVGLSEVDRTDEQRTVAEQCALLEGLCWGWVRMHLNRLLSEFRIIEVEREESFVLGCTCGLGDMRGEPEDHEARDCYGLCQQSRPDFVTERRSDGQLGIDDWKTIGYDLKDTEIERYRTSVQMAVGTLGVERRLGKPITHYYIHFLHKGARRKGYTSPGVFDGPRQQQSHFCYVTLIPGSPGNPPLTPAVPDTYTTEDPWYRKVPTWMLNPEAAPPGWSPLEWWVEQMPDAVLAKLYPVVGPYDRQTWMISGHLRSMQAEEKRWVRRVWEVYEQVQAGVPLRDALDEVIPPSWDCWRYNSTCQFRDLCTHAPGLPAEPNAIMASGRFQLRVPHHEYELRALRESGVPLPAEMVPTGADEGGEEG